MTDERAIRMAQETAALAVAMRRYVEEQQHDTGGCAEDPCLLCAAPVRPKALVGAYFKRTHVR